MIKYKRKIRKKYVRNTILILCEGEKTEPNYFKVFKEKLKKFNIVLEVMGDGYNTDSLVEQAIELKNQKEINKEPYLEVWCVFDRDSFSKQNFNRAFEIANSNNIKTAYSNEAFEIWYLLHFEYCIAGISRKQYIEKLEGYLEKYEKNDKTMYQKLVKKQDIAIQNAEKLLDRYTSATSKYDMNPSTTVFRLVERLNECRKNKNCIKGDSNLVV